jgi:glycosyltransferase involved in cell wall biosynthesis
MRLLNVFRRVHERVPRARLRIVGAGPLEPALREYCRDFAIEGFAEFPGSVEHHLLVDIYQDADLFILTSRHEAQGMAVLEAAACGLPVIGTRVGILPEIGQVEDDDEALSDAIVRLANDPDALGMIRQKIRARVERDYSLPVSLARWEGIYESLLRTRSGVPSA